ncbi:MAG: hypothetical protein ABI451_08985, partial [Dokdonella sp.]
DWLQVILGGVVIGLGDTIFATMVWSSWDSAGFTRLFQTIAVGLLGKASYDGGTGAALVGVLSHFFIATMFVLTYALVSRRNPSLLGKPLVFGPLYGVLLYLIMNFVVLPISRVGRFPSLQHIDWIVLSILAHMVFGVICVYFSRRALHWLG